MSADTQLPRYQVFLQEKVGAPYQDVGSVHAADPEMALYNARDVFVRRPDCFSLWVVPASQIYSRTAQELEAEKDPTEPSGTRAGDRDRVGETGESYQVFCKEKSAGTQTWLAEFEAKTPARALDLARTMRREAGKSDPFAWWVLPTRQITASQAEDIASFFAPAREKTFRLSSDFRTHSTMRSIKGQHSGEPEKK